MPERDNPPEGEEREVYRTPPEGGTPKQIMWTPSDNHLAGGGRFLRHVHRLQTRR